jgi:hypothetical protein
MPEETVWYVWENEFGTIVIDTSERGHYASTCLGTFNSYDEAFKFADSQKLLFWFMKPDGANILSDHFECEKGWHLLINEALRKIEEIIIRDDLDIQIMQIKEKLGGLRIYLSSTTDEIDSIIKEAEGKALRTCEICGSPGRFLSTFTGWYVTRCKKCEEKGFQLVEESKKGENNA